MVLLYIHATIVLWGHHYGGCSVIFWQAGFFLPGPFIWHSPSLVSIQTLTSVVWWETCAGTVSASTRWVPTAAPANPATPPTSPAQFAWVRPQDLCFTDPLPALPFLPSAQTTWADVPHTRLKNSARGCLSGSSVSPPGTSWQRDQTASHPLCLPLSFQTWMSAFRHPSLATSSVRTRREATSAPALADTSCRKMERAAKVSLSHTHAHT